MSMQCMLIRHPRPDIAPGLCYGRLDIGWHPDAMRDVAYLRRSIRGFNPTRMWTSPARRCRDLVEDWADPLCRVDERLLEMHFGAWEGQAWSHIPRTDLDAWALAPQSFTPPGGESAAQLMDRVQAFAQDLRGTVHSTEGAKYVVIAHGGSLRLLRAMLLGHVVNVLAPSPPMASCEVLVLR